MAKVDPSREWNMNLGWILYLNDIVKLYGEAHLNDDYERMYKCLRLLESTISPKIDNDESEQKLKKIKLNIRAMIVKDAEGRTIKYFPRLIDETVDLLEEVYSLLLLKLEKEGILTFKPKDPKTIFGNFGGS